MNIWIVTTGSSDVQLKSDEYWSDWYERSPVKRNCYDLPFKPTQIIEDSDESYRVAPRVLGMVYEAQLEEVWECLKFPLLQEFTTKLEGEEIDKIILLLTDQTPVFNEDQQEDAKCPYWQDTCKLKPIFELYFQAHFPNAKLIPQALSPQENERGLDDWNDVLKIVRTALDKALDNIELEPDTVYVSHQAGTPAISSAVQFASLARFRTNVEFLVSNEYNHQTYTIPRSTYLGAIQLQEATALLKHHDYVGVRDILGLTKTAPSTPKDKRIKYLLDAGEQWNFAEFQKFKKILLDRKLLSFNNFPWYQSGYESLYLAWVRLKQGSTVDALFHSFRAAEGSIIKWTEKNYSSHLVKDPRYGLQIKLSICQKLPDYFKALSEPNQKKFQTWGQIGLYGDQLYELLKQARPEWKDHPDIKIVWEVAKKQRNNCFHRIEGLQESEVFDAWDTKTQDDWKNRTINCLNFIAKQDLPQDFTLLEEASLMAKVHKELVEAIAFYL